MMKINRRRFLTSAAVAPLAARAWVAEAATPARTLMFAGTQTKETSKGIYAYEWDAAKGSLNPPGLAAETPTPSFLALAPNGKCLYAVNELDEYEGKQSGSISAYSIDRGAAKLNLLNVVASTGSGPCHLSIDKTGRALFAANYDGGSAASFRIAADGRLSAAVSQFHYQGHGPDKDRQEAPHAHRATVSPDNRFVLINDLGLDCIHIYNLNAATAVLTPHNPPQWNATPGSGPRALRFHPKGNVAYCIEEMASVIDVLSWNAQRGALNSIQRLSLVPDDAHAGSTGSEVVVDRSGRFVYAADRGYDCVATFAVNEANGTLKLLNRKPCGGKVPRHIALDPTERWLLVANQESDTIAVFERNAQTGRLSSQKTYPISKPQCLVFA
jgi:6-phosphogluconolactonase